MSVVAQLTIDGNELPVDRIVPRVTPAASSVLVYAVRNGGAGAYGCRQPLFPGASGCCRYAASDGRTVLKQLESSGIVERIGHGLYAVLEPHERGAGA